MKTILVTGSTAGFGKLIVQAFLKNGDQVIATGRRLSERTEIFAADRALYGKKLIEMDLDVSSPAEVENILSKIQTLDVLINNAGYGLFGALEDCSEKEINYQMDVNFYGTVRLIKLFLPLLRTSQGKIFNFSSAFGYMGFPLTSLYCASKFAIEGLTESLRSELAPHHVQVCLIQPGGFTTDFIKNVNWSSTISPVYKLQVDNYKKLHTFQSRWTPQNPEIVSKGLVRLANKKNIPLRKRFGRDSHFGHIFRKLMPTCFYDGIMGLIHKVVFQNKFI